MTNKRIGLLGLLIVGIFGLFVGLFSMFENLDADQIMVIQSPISGTLDWYVTPGIKPQAFGKVTTYYKRSQFWFSKKKDQGKEADESLKIRFNDGGHADISGSIAWEMPIDKVHLNLLHMKYGSHHAIEQQLIRTVVEKAVYMTGPLMSSKESYAEKRNLLLQYIEDQVQNGVFRTVARQVQQPDPMTGQPRTVSVVDLVMTDGQIARVDVSPLQDFGIRTFNPSINQIEYDKIVEEQIAQQQKAIMQVQTAVARAKEAEQEAATAAKNGQALAAKAQWEQEVIKVRAVTEARQKLEVAQLEAQAAEQTKIKEIKLGEGESERRRLVMSADGALTQKLATYEKVMIATAGAIKDYQGNWVPVYNSGGQMPVGGGATQLLEAISIKALRDLGLDLNATGRENTSKKK